MTKAQPHTISGKVIHGDHYGRKIGFPTANIDRKEYLRKKMNITFGIWAGVGILHISKYKFQTLPAAIVIGPLDKSGRPKLEAHLIGFTGNIYGRKMTIALHKYIRPFRIYTNEENLKKQISLDIEKVKRQT